MYRAGMGSEGSGMADQLRSVCYNQSELDLDLLPYLHESDAPAAYLISPPDDKFHVGTLCIGLLVYIPDAYTGHDSHGLKIEDYPPDSIYLEIIGNDFQVIPRTTAEYQETYLQNKGVIRYYNLNVRFIDPDVYSVSGYLEYINFLWNFEVAEDVFWNPFPLKILRWKNSKFELVDKLNLTIKGTKLNPRLYKELPICKNGNAEGRWVKSSMIEEPSEFINSSSDWSTPRDAMTNFKDPEGRVWVPYKCRYLPMSYSEFSSCISESDTFLHFYGDSNMRRALKAILTGGAWCNSFHDPDSNECRCSDQNTVSVPNLNDSEYVNYFAKVSGRAGFSILFERVNGFQSQQGPFDQILNASHLLDSASKFGYNNTRMPSAVIFNLVNWDAGFYKWDDFKTNVHKIVTSMKATYSGIPIIFRPGQYYSGRVDTSVGSGLPRRYSRLRVDAFNQYAIKVFQELIPDQIKIWDIAALGESQSPSLKSIISECVSNHMFRTGIDLENQLLFNLLCKRNSQNQ